jgi:type VI secretion system protein ImpJ
MFLRAQHFQQQDRHADHVGRAQLAAARPYGWGIGHLALNRDLLGTGRFALCAAEGLFEDGTWFSIPGDADHPPPLEPGPTVKDEVVYLCVPVGQPGAQEVADAEAGPARWDLAPFAAEDTHTGSPHPAELQVGRLRLRYKLESDTLAGFHRIGVARIREVTPDRRIVLDETWMPPALACAAVPPLVGLIDEFHGMLRQLGGALARQVSAPAQYGVGSFENFLALLTANRWQGLLGHWGAAGARLHPLDFYEALVAMAGEFATFAGDRRPADYQPYRHEDLQASYAPVVADLRRLLARTRDTNAVQIPLRKHPTNPVWAGEIADRTLLAGRLVLVATARMPADAMRSRLPKEAKVASIPKLTELVTALLPGIPLRPLPVAPPQLPFLGGEAVYFGFQQDDPRWQELRDGPGIAVHVAGDYPGLKFDLWAIRGG